MNACGDSRLRGLRSRKPIGFRQWVVHNGQAEKDADEKDETAEKTVSADQADADTGDIQEGDGEDHGI